LLAAQLRSLGTKQCTQQLVVFTQGHLIQARD
jgi:hypothetical protein